MDRIRLAQLPTPLERAERLSEAWGADIWIKRDDLTGFGFSGNKVRKLEFHLAAALAAGADTVMTCGAVQSNHCRATALAAARVGLGCVLYLRSADGQPPAEVRGNHLLSSLAGAEIRYIDPAQYQDRTELMAAAATTSTWVIPEGASDRHAVVAFEAAVDELVMQLEEPYRKHVLWHASSSAGTTAGLARGAARYRRDGEANLAVVGSSVGDTAEYLSRRVQGLLAEFGNGSEDASFEIVDRYIGRGYGLTTDDELAVQVEATRLTGLIWDPTYTGKAVVALKREIDAGRFGRDDRIVLWHTGGGFAAFSHDFSGVLG